MRCHLPLPVRCGAIAFLASLLVATFLLADMPLAGDGTAYWEEAGLWLEGMGERPWYYPPGMVLWVALFRALGFGYRHAADLSVAFLAAGTAAIATALSGRLTGNRKLAGLAGLLAAFYPPGLLLASQPVSQHLAQTCLGGVALGWLASLDHWQRGGALWRWPVLGWLLGTGLALGMGILARPSLASVGLAVLATAVASAWQRGGKAVVGGRFSARRDAPASPMPDVNLPASPAPNTRWGVDCRWLATHWRLGGPGLLVAGVALLVLLPFLLHNHRVGAGACISINNERNFWLGNNPYTPLYKTTHLAQRALAELPEETQVYLLRHYIRSEVTNPRLRTELSRTLRKIRLLAAWEHIVDRPELFALRSANRSRAFWGFDYLGTRQIQAWRGWSFRRAAPLHLLEAGGYAAIAGLAIIGILGAGRFGQWQLPAFILAYQLPYCLAFSAGTYHFPVMVLLFPLAAIGWQALGRTGGWRVVSRWPVAVALSIFALVQIEYALFAWKYL